MGGKECEKGGDSCRASEGMTERGGEDRNKGNRGGRGGASRPGFTRTLSCSENAYKMSDFHDQNNYSALFT